MVYRACHVELECDSGLARDPERLKERIRYLFGLAKASVEVELDGTNAAGNRGSAASGNGHVANGSGTNGNRSDLAKVAVLEVETDLMLKLVIWLVAIWLFVAAKRGGSR
jgi:hypothetical protein